MIQPVGLQIFKQKFQISFDKCDKQIRGIFLNLINRISQHPVKQWTTNKPDYRIGKKFNICEFVLLRNSLKINLRVDNHILSSNSLKLSETYKFNTVAKWYSFKLFNKNQINEATSLIEKAIKFNE